MHPCKVTHHAPAHLRAEQFKAKTKCSPPSEHKKYTNSHSSPVSAIPEYAPMGAVLISYPGTVPATRDDPQAPPSGPRMFGIPNELIVRMQQNDSAEPVHIFVMCEDRNEKKNIDHDLQATADEKGLFYNPEHLHLIGWDTDTYWTRDYGPWWIINNETGYFGIAKHCYTTMGGGQVGMLEGAEHVDPMEGLGIFRPNDDYGAVKLSDYLNGPIRKWNLAQWPGRDKDHPLKNEPINVHNWYFLGLLDVGGNYMVTGNGVIASSYLVATQNELPVHQQEHSTNPGQKQIDQRMEYILSQFNQFMGISTYHVLTDPTGTYIGHIDCWGKFLADDIVLIARSEDPKTDKAFDGIADYFTQQGFTVSRVMCQNMYISIADQPATTAAYTNSLILNDHVYVPLSGKGYEEFDNLALSAYRKALPDHTVVGIPSKPETPWLGTDAMHCRTRAVPREVVNNWLKSQNLK
ncbi:MAG: agmatine/peptidylarginine deiminase [Psychromonas sp.]|jgi:agmatine/peptidylarginine deiminase|uniref:agmatine deiminase family protein n=1 Tax=Psychromonas sp. TaxID=1884585 RepID=UPI0039E4DF28